LFVQGPIYCVPRARAEISEFSILRFWLDVCRSSLILFCQSSDASESTPRSTHFIAYSRNATRASRSASCLSLLPSPRQPPGAQQRRLIRKPVPLKHILRFSRYFARFDHLITSATRILQRRGREGMQLRELDLLDGYLRTSAVPEGSDLKRNGLRVLLNKRR
jgi:hypothetical protein